MPKPVRTGRATHEPYDHAVRRKVEARFRVVLRTSLGFAALGVGSSVCGSGVVASLLLVQGLPGDVGDRGWVLSLTAAGIVALSLVVGTVWTAWLQRWLQNSPKAAPTDARKAVEAHNHREVGEPPGTRTLNPLIKS